MTPRMRNLLLGAALVAAALAIYFPVTGFGLVNYDDDTYLLAPSLPDGLSAANVAWAFTTFYHSNWHPLTWISWMTEIELFGARPGVLHLGNVLLHAANGALLYAALLALTRKAWPSFLVAALFVVHPMHVESVAWISERKDVLSVFFGLCTLLAYARYARAPGPAGSLVVAACFALSLLAKPMLVTLPFALLLLDYWPLARRRTQGWRPLVLEKLPLLALCAVSCVLTWQAQATGGALRSEGFPLLERLANAANAYVGTVGKTFAPWNLAPLYPRPPQGPDWMASALAALGLALVSWNAWVFRTRFPYLWVGWAWFVGTLVPVIGLVPIGEHAMADRYAYWPHIGLFVGLAFWLDAVAFFEGRARVWRNAAGASCALCVGVLAVQAWRQTHIWKDSETLWRHTLEVTTQNYVAHANLGQTLQATDPLEAQAHFGAALAINADAFRPAPAPPAPSGDAQSDR